MIVPADGNALRSLPPRQFRLTSAIVRPADSCAPLCWQTQPTVALVEDTGFRMTFELAGRRLDQLDDISQVSALRRSACTP